jgi:hypothetical protein
MSAAAHSNYEQSWLFVLRQLKDNIGADKLTGSTLPFLNQFERNIRRQ